MPFIYLDVETNLEQLKIVQPLIEDLRAGNLMKDADGDGAVKKVAERKLNAIGNINLYFYFVNDDTNLEKMRNQLQLAASISEIGRIQRADQTLKKSKEHAKQSCWHLR